jgi:hypothetical protein
MTVTDCKVIFNLQKQILNAPELSSDRKVEILRACIYDTIGDSSCSQTKNADEQEDKS